MGKCCSCWPKAWRFGLFLVVLFVICFIWYFVMPAQQDLMLSQLQMSFFWFSGMNFWSFILGAIQTFIWGLIISVIWCGIMGCGCECKTEHKE
ncbi:MAG: hypothetical protein V1763_01345 [Parcubacteria group bacterium]